MLARFYLIPCPSITPSKRLNGRAKKRMLFFLLLSLWCGQLHMTHCGQDSPQDSVLTFVRVSLDLVLPVVFQAKWKKKEKETRNGIRVPTIAKQDVLIGLLCSLCHLSTTFFLLIKAVGRNKRGRRGEGETTKRDNRGGGTEKVCDNLTTILHAHTLTPLYFLLELTCLGVILVFRQDQRCRSWRKSLPVKLPSSGSTTRACFKRAPLPNHLTWIVSSPLWKNTRMCSDTPYSSTTPKDSQKKVTGVFLAPYS